MLDEKERRKGRMAARPTQALLSQVDEASAPLAADSVLGGGFYGNTVYGLAPLNPLGGELTEALILGPLICPQAHWAPCLGLLLSLERNPKASLSPASSGVES